MLRTADQSMVEILSGKQQGCCTKTSLDERCMVQSRRTTAFKMVMNALHYERVARIYQSDF